jgi:hypothetical protein
MFLHEDSGYLAAGAEARCKLAGVRNDCPRGGHNLGMLARREVDGELKLAPDSN